MLPKPKKLEKHFLYEAVILINFENLRQLKCILFRANLNLCLSALSLVYLNLFIVSHNILHLIYLQVQYLQSKISEKF